ncbi:hypothetical protein CR513_42257, partial [Mucuna pruriens]
MKYKQGKVNIVVDALSRRYTLLAMLETKLLGFESLKDLYVIDVNFSEAYDHCAVSANGASFRMKGFYLKKNSSIRELLVKEAHEGELMGHFGVCQTYEALCEHFYWPKMRRDKCLVYKIAKSKASSNGLYTLLRIPTAP